MDYEENKHSNNNKNTTTGLIIAIAVAILVIALVAWFALKGRDNGGGMSDMVSDIKSDIASVYDDMKSDVESVVSDVKSDISSTASDIESEYNSTVSSYNDTVSDVKSELSTSSDATMPTEDKVSSVPYSKNTFTKPCEGEIIKDFSTEELQYSKTFGDMRLHSGIDIACKKGTSVSAAGNGKILTIEENSQYGNIVTLDLGNNMTAKYSSLDDIKVKEGDTVKAGDIIGVTATIPAECNDEDHLHFEVFKNGVAVAPFEELKLK